MSLTFNQILEAENIDPRDVRLLRNQARGDDGQTPYRLWCDDREMFEAYQSAQKVQDRSRLAATYWASFIVTADGRTLFAGLYNVAGRSAIDDDWPYPIGSRPARGVDELYLFSPVTAFGDYAGRLFIDWGTATRSWIQRADRQDKQITELTARLNEPAFPGYTAFCEPLSRILVLPTTWTAALSAARGVYILTCPNTKELYVGSATGEQGFYGRWCGYALNGHGGNVKLRSREPRDYQISILEVAGSGDQDVDILAAESRWKQKLQSREMGLNAN
ncbi:MAG: GIY-YIG nuclease family protein [Cyanobacteria bacterium J06555_12]